MISDYTVKINAQVPIMSLLLTAVCIRAFTVHSKIGTKCIRYDIPIILYQMRYYACIRYDSKIQSGSDYFDCLCHNVNTFWHIPPTSCTRMIDIRVSD